MLFVLFFFVGFLFSRIKILRDSILPSMMNKHPIYMDIWIYWKRGLDVIRTHAHTRCACASICGQIGKKNVFEMLSLSILSSTDTPMIIFVFKFFWKRMVEICDLDRQRRERMLYCSCSILSRSGCNIYFYVKPTLSEVDSSVTNGLPIMLELLPTHESPKLSMDRQIWIWDLGSRDRWIVIEILNFA